MVSIRWDQFQRAQAFIGGSLRSKGVLSIVQVLSAYPVRSRGKAARQQKGIAESEGNHTEAGIARGAGAGPILNPRLCSKPPLLFLLPFLGFCTPAEGFQETLEESRGLLLVLFLR